MHVGNPILSMLEGEFSQLRPQELAGEDGRFHPAQGKIDGATLVVSSEKVPQPKAVRYAFTCDATPNLMNRAGLPASSFRSDG